MPEANNTVRQIRAKVDSLRLRVTAEPKNQTRKISECLLSYLNAGNELVQDL